MVLPLWAPLTCICAENVSTFFPLYFCAEKADAVYGERLTNIQLKHTFVYGVAVFHTVAALHGQHSLSPKIVFFSNTSNKQKALDSFNMKETNIGSFEKMWKD